MAKRLDVYLHDNLVGRLMQDDHGDMNFGYTTEWLKQPSSMPLSYSLPLREETFSRQECRGFFAGLLPEENKRELIAKNLGISPRNDFTMLEQIGGECAGAVTFIPVGSTLPMRMGEYRDLDDNELSAILKELPKRPLLAGDEDIRLSLAGAQDKIPVYVSGHQISIPLGEAPSTHILKPANQYFEGLVINEAFCMKLAKTIGLSVADIDMRSVGGIDYLLVERYDRAAIKEHSSHKTVIKRLHQEDLCQALNIPPEKKYQVEEGPSLKQCFNLLRDISTAPVLDIQRLLDAVIYNFLIGNHDAHGKNFSLVYNKTKASEVRLSPLYDLVSTVYYPDLTKKMAMKIGGEYRSADILPQHFELMSEETGLAKPFVKARVLEMGKTIIQELDKSGTTHNVALEIEKLILTRCKYTIDIFKN